MKKGEPIAAIFSRSHLDPTVFGEDAHEFKPERMLDQNFDRLQKEFPNCWKPFGNGMRACIGRPFAWQEMLLAASLLLQNFDFQLNDPSYTLKISETLTIKPKDFLMRATLRHGMLPLDLEWHLHSNGNQVGATPSEKLGTATTSSQSGSEAAKPISIFYGSNSGTCEALARRLASGAATHGFKPSVVDSLDAAKDRLPQDHPAILLLSSYEGQPPDNARHFVTWLESMSGEEMDKVAYAVFGAGNSEWRQTFHRVPKLVDDALEKRQAERIAPLGLTDVSKRDPFLDFESWEDGILWPALETRYSVTNPTNEANPTGLIVDVSAPRASTLRQNLREAVVTRARDLTAPGMPQKKHIEIRLPTGIPYEAGDYLTVLPMNPRATVARVLRRFKLSWDTVLTISGYEGTLLPLEKPTSASDVLSSYVELSQPATKKNILSLVAIAGEGKVRDELVQLATGDCFEKEIMHKRVSVLDLLERNLSIEVPVSTFLSMLPPMRIRR